MSRLALGPTQPPIQWVLGLSHGGKTAGVGGWTLTSLMGSCEQEKLHLLRPSVMKPSMCLSLCQKANVCWNLLHITLIDRNLTCCHYTMFSNISVFIVWNTGKSIMHFITELKKCNVKHFTPVKTDIHLNYVPYLSIYLAQNIVHLLQWLTNENHGTMQCFMMLWQVVCYWTESLHFLPWS
jgi:hypothetical protein